MRTMRGRRARLAALGVAVALLAGCGGEAGEDGPGTTPETVSTEAGADAGAETDAGDEAETGTEAGTATDAATAEETGAGEGADDPERAEGAGLAEEVTFTNEGLDLVGTLRLPDAAEPDAPVPGVLIVAGSGPQSRDGMSVGQLGLTFSTTVPIYREVAEALVDEGYAVLTWDKRTCGPFNDCAENEYPLPGDDLTFDTLRADAGAALDLLAADPRVDELVVIGHSKGGTVGAGLVAERDDIDALVLLASPEPPITDVLDVQVQTFAELVRAAGQEGPQSAMTIAQLQNIANQARAIGEGETEGADLSGASREFWASWIAASEEAPEQVAGSGVPVLALGGEYDWNVPPEMVQAWEPHLPEGSSVEILPNITHALTYLPTDDPAALSPGDVGEEVDDSVVAALTSWLATALP
ncbi:MAG: alpha/beta fold hydrolase [Actinomycetia bacterium]|nr:alpha/beta fold hydrolase [Actinomycetes bacterium]